VTGLPTINPWLLLLLVIGYTTAVALWTFTTVWLLTKLAAVVQRALRKVIGEWTGEPEDGLDEPDAAAWQREADQQAAQEPEQEWPVVM
jgi:hypothetical protein